MNWELPDVQNGFRKGRRTRDKIANIHWIIEKAREFQRNICFTDYTKAFDCLDHNKLWKIFQEMGIPDRVVILPVSWEICMQVKKQQLELYMEQQTGPKSGKEYVKAVFCHSAHLTYMQSTSWEMLDKDEAQAVIKITRRNLNNLRYTDDTTLMAESEELKSLSMKVKEESKKVGLKPNIQKTRIMASSTITSWQTDG